MKPLYSYTCQHRASMLAEDGYLRAGRDLLTQERQRLLVLDPIASAIHCVGWLTDIDDLCYLNGHRVGLAPPEILGCDRTAFRFRALEPQGILPWTMIQPLWGPIGSLLDQALESARVYVSTKPIPVMFSPHHSGQRLPEIDHVDS